MILLLVAALFLKWGPITLPRLLRTPGSHNTSTSASQTPRSAGISHCRKCQSWIPISVPLFLAAFFPFKGFDSLYGNSSKQLSYVIFFDIGKLDPNFPLR